MILANHVSLLDAIALASRGEFVFVTSRDITESIFLRWFATIAGTVLIERRNRDRRSDELLEIESLLQEGRTIVLFPEATSTDGSQILRFRNGLLHAALRATEIRVLPVCLQYRSIGDRALTTKNRDRIFLYGEIGIATHLARILTGSAVQLSLLPLKEFNARDFATPAEIAAHAEFLVRSAFHPIQPETDGIFPKADPSANSSLPA